MARASSHDDPPAEEPATEEAPAKPSPEEAQAQINETMEATATDDTPSVYPPGADELTAENVRRYPDLFTDEQKATIPDEELPLTDVEQAQAEAAEKAEAEADK